MKPIAIEKTDIKVVRANLFVAAILAICSLVVVIGFLIICNSLIQEEKNYDLIFYIKIIFLVVFLLGFLYVMKIYLSSSIKQIKDLKNGVKYGFETRINKKEIIGKDTESSGIPFIYTPIEDFKEFQISQKEYNKLKEGDKVYLETLPISKILLNIKKI